MTTLTGVAMIAAERQRQVAVEGWTPEHDDTHLEGEMVEGARGYLSAAFLAERGRTWDGAPPPFWPWNQSWWKPSDDPIRNLVKAGALIAAEIERLQRASGAAAAPEPSAPSAPGDLEALVQTFARDASICLSEDVTDLLRRFGRAVLGVQA